MQEYIRKDRNGNELKVGDKVNRIEGNEIICSGEVSLPQYYTEWANKEDTIWIKLETAPRDFEDNIGQILWTYTEHVEKIDTKQEFNKPTPHPHAELIKLWADDLSIKFQYKFKDSVVWNDLNADPVWNKTLEYRVKPKEKKFVDKYYYTYKNARGQFVTTTRLFSDEEWGNFINDLGITQYVKLHFSLTKLEIK